MRLRKDACHEDLPGLSMKLTTAGCLLFALTLTLFLILLAVGLQPR